MVPNQSGEEKVHEIMATVDRIRPILAGRDPGVQSGIIAELMAGYLSGWRCENVRRLRQELFDHFEVLVWQLVAVSDEHAAGEHDEESPANGGSGHAGA